jgi:hypothetical protein
MMDELVQELSQKTGLSPEKSQEVVNVVITHLKARLPEPLANGLDSLWAGNSAGGENLAEKAISMATGLGSMFGKTSQ